MVRPRTPVSRAQETAKRLEDEYPGTAAELCALDFKTPFQLLVATILSAQTTDERVNLTTPALFKRFPGASSLAEADPTEVEEMVKSTGFFRNKTKSIMGMAAAVVNEFNGRIPEDMEDLVKLPGVGRKTANVLLSVAMNKPGLPVDTHVTRLSNLLGLTKEKDAVKIETALCSMLAPEGWGGFSLRMILHGRRVCIARRPKCEICILNDFCPSAQLPTVETGPAQKSSRTPKPQKEKTKTKTTASNPTSARTTSRAGKTGKSQ